MLQVVVFFVLISGVFILLFFQIRLSEKIRKIDF